MLQVRVIFLSAIAYTAKAGVLTGHHSPDSYVSSALSAPSASYGAPSSSYGAPSSSYGAPSDSYGPPLHSSGSLQLGDVSAPSGGSYAPSGGSYAPAYPAAPYPGQYNQISGASLPAPLPAAGLPTGGPYNEGSLLLDATLPARPGAAVTSTAVGAPRVIGTTVTVGRPIASATRYELQSVIQDVIRRVPVEVTRHVQVAVPQPVPVPVRQEVRVPVPQPYPVHVDVVKHVPYDVYKTEHHEVERPVPVEVIKHVPYEVIRKVHVPVDKPYEVIRKIHVPIEKHVEVPVAVWKPYPIHIIKHVTHYKKKSCCW